jgi:hypothetical protein
MSNRTQFEEHPVIRRRLSLLTVVAPGLRVLFDRIGKPEIMPAA